jgi:hypothetical protein
MNSLPQTRITVPEQSEMADVLKISGAGRENSLKNERILGVNTSCIFE